MKKHKLAAILMSAAIMLSSCGAEYAGSVGGEKITKAEFDFYLTSVKQQMQGTELESEEAWETQEIEGKKAIDIARERAFDTAAQNLSYIQVAKKLGLDLTDEEKTMVDSYKSLIIKNNGGQAEYESFLKEYGITDSFIDMMCSSMMYTDKLISKIAEEEPVTDSEAEAYFKEHYRRAKHVLILTMDMNTQTPYEGDKLEEAKKRADEVLARAKNGDNFESLIDEYNEDPGMVSLSDGYVFTDGEMMQEFADGVDSIKPGEITMAQTPYGYHIIKRLALDETPEYFAEALGEKRKQIEYAINHEKLDKRMDKWVEEYDIKIEKNSDVINKED